MIIGEFLMVKGTQISDFEFGIMDDILTTDIRIGLFPGSRKAF